MTQYVARLRESKDGVKFTRACTIEELMQVLVEQYPVDLVYQIVEDDLGYRMVQIGAIAPQLVSVPVTHTKVSPSSTTPPVEPIPADAKQVVYDEDYLEEEEDQPEDFREAKAYSHVHAKGPYATSPSAKKKRNKKELQGFA